jgi:hypothetical protein
LFHGFSMRRLVVILVTGLALRARSSASRVGADEIADRKAQAEQIGAKLSDHNTTAGDPGRGVRSQARPARPVEVDIDGGRSGSTPPTVSWPAPAEVNNYAVAAFRTTAPARRELLSRVRGESVARSVPEGGLGQPAESSKRGRESLRADAELAQLARVVAGQSLRSRPERSDTEKASTGAGLLAGVNGELSGWCRTPEASGLRQTGAVRAACWATPPATPMASRSAHLADHR